MILELIALVLKIIAEYPQFKRDVDKSRVDRAKKTYIDWRNGYEKRVADRAALAHLIESSVRNATTTKDKL